MKKRRSYPLTQFDSGEVLEDIIVLSDGTLQFTKADALVMPKAARNMSLDVLSRAPLGVFEQIALTPRERKVVQ